VAGPREAPIALISPSVCPAEGAARSPSLPVSTPPATLILMPTYNERENLPRIVPAIHAVVPFAHLLVIDDGSPDGTGALADEMARADERIHVLHRAGKQGLGKAYLAGFRWALDGPWERIVEMDADFSHDPAYLPALLDASSDADVAIGSRYVAGGGTRNWGVGRRLLSRGGGLYARTVLGMSVQDLTAGFVCYRREALERLPLDEITSNGYVFQIELKYRCHKLGMSLVEVPIIFPDRVAGESKMTSDIAREAILQVIRLRRRLG
jgi:dolichol-phosphate mannosyltransferase